MTIEEVLKSEVENGEELELEMASGLHAVIGANLDWYLGSFVRANNLGWVLNSSATYNFHDNLPRREPASSFVTFEKMPVPPDDELNFAPELAAEVVSKNDKIYEVEAKVKQYQQAGVKLIWIIYPFSQTVEVYRLDTGLKSQRFVGDEELDGADVLPGFKLKVSALFSFKNN